MADQEESERSASAPSVFGQSVGGSARSVKSTVTLQGDLYGVATGKQMESIRVTGRASETKVGADGPSFGHRFSPAEGLSPFLG